MKNRFTKLGQSILLVSILSGCANSASHKIVSLEKATDEYMSCSNIRTEKRKVQAIINGVQRDKEDIDGADFVDGLLWFPFNLLAKSSNYSNATEAAEARIEYLSVMEAENRCKVTSNGGSKSDSKTSNQLAQLNSLYKDGILTKEEFMQKRKGILAQLDDTNGSSQNTPRRIGEWGFAASKLAKENGCDSKYGASMITKNGSTSFYQVICNGNREPMLLKCQYGKCEQEG